MTCVVAGRAVAAAMSAGIGSQGAKAAGGGGGHRHAAGALVILVTCVLISSSRGGRGEWPRFSVWREETRQNEKFGPFRL